MQLQSFNSPTTLLPKKKREEKPFKSISLVMFMGDAIVVGVDLSGEHSIFLEFCKFFAFSIDS